MTLGTRAGNLLTRAGQLLFGCRCCATPCQTTLDCEFCEYCDNAGAIPSFTCLPLTCNTLLLGGYTATFEGATFNINGQWQSQGQQFDAETWFAFNEGFSPSARDFSYFKNELCFGSLKLTQVKSVNLSCDTFGNIISRRTSECYSYNTYDGIPCVNTSRRIRQKQYNHGNPCDLLENPILLEDTGTGNRFPPLGGFTPCTPSDVSFTINAPS